MGRFFSVVYSESLWKCCFVDYLSANVFLFHLISSIYSVSMQHCCYRFFTKWHCSSTFIQWDNINPSAHSKMKNVFNLCVLLYLFRSIFWNRLEIEDICVRVSVYVDWLVKLFCHLNVTAIYSYDLLVGFNWCSVYDSFMQCNRNRNLTIMLNSHHHHRCNHSHWSTSVLHLKCVF